MDQKTDSTLYIYIGPALLCPKKKRNREYLIITGDRGDSINSLIQTHTNGGTTRNDFKIKNNTIGRPGTTKRWDKFKQSIFNGITRRDLVNWYNSEEKFEYIGTHEVENKVVVQPHKHSNDQFVTKEDYEKDLYNINWQLKAIEERVVDIQARLSP